MENSHCVCTILPDLLCFSPEGDVGLFQVEQHPGLGTKVGPMETSQSHVVAMETHRAAQLHSILWQWHLEEGNVTSSHHLQHSGPMSVMSCIHI